MHEYRPGGQGFRARLIRVLCRVFVWPTMSWWPLRGPLSKLMPLVDLVLRATPRLRATEVERVAGGHWRAELVRPRGSANASAALLYLHGGAFVFCGLATHRRVVERLALRTGLPVLSVRYRHLPKGCLDESLADATEAFRWLVGRGFDGGSIVCVGDSAGGHLAFALALAAERAGLDRPAGVVGLSPWLDFDCQVKQAHPNSRTDVFIPARRLSRVARLCTATPAGDIDPLRSPVNGNLACLPPVLIQCAEDEVLRCDAELMAERLEAAGVTYRLQVWQGQVHAFPVLGHVLPESRAALDEIAGFVAEVVQGDRRLPTSTRE
ncbi:alpha/beta hydrolase [Actinokineospora iranica]|uniref:Acetyl esterase/lipase n=1 Tax=Actinokineospora iranica TaxID=1271860 RepID=A0A1G6JV09_9PSEU|nr:alpha/beta hydrolase [Actinokineospora iranica]SDC22235.1 Acetyl esterase/lipase [Actinokineospora iranica]